MNEVKPTAAKPFVHLHCHTHFSLLDGASRIPDLVQHVKSLGMNACAITDHGNLYGAIDFYAECKKAGINPVVGYEAYVAPGSRTDKAARKRGDAGFHLTILAKNNVGWKNLIKLASIASVEGYHYVPRIDKECLEAHRDGLIVLSGCASSEFSEYILTDKMKEARELAGWFHRVFGKNFYVEIQNNFLKIQQVCKDGAIDIANKLGLPLVATSDAHYLRKEDAVSHDVLLCINTGAMRDDRKRMRYGEDAADGTKTMLNTFYVCSPAEMYTRFPTSTSADAVRRSQEIADGVNIDLDFTKRHFPVFTPPNNETPESHLRKVCEQGLQERYGDKRTPEVLKRLEHELNIVLTMGFAGYFLIVWDFVRFARENGIPCGARGSACGALIAYLLYLSHVDPIEHGLLFERFLDPSRSEAPDIDMDICTIRRVEVLEYVKRKYGEDCVAQIGTFGTLGAKGAIRDVGRALNVPLPEVNKVSAFVPKGVGVTIAIARAAGLDSYLASHPEHREWFAIAESLEGLNRNPGTHAAGVVIAAEPLVNHVPLQRPPKKDAIEAMAGLTTQWDMGAVEKVGLLKADFLGLNTLTCLDECVRVIYRRRGVFLDLDHLPPGDPDTYKLLQRGDTQGVFQFEADGISKKLRDIKPDRLNDIIAATSLYRPGPLGGGMVDAYINRKHGREAVPKVHPIYDRLLAETYGVMVYQEQVMQVMNQLGGIPLARAYATIKAISKKKHDVINKSEADFVKGAAANNLPEAKAREIFTFIKEFGGYGFNKCMTADTMLWTRETTVEKVDSCGLLKEKVEMIPRSIRDLMADCPWLVVESRLNSLVRIPACGIGIDNREKGTPPLLMTVGWRHGPVMRDTAESVVKIILQGVRPVFRLLTASGRKIVVTSNHPFLKKFIDTSLPGYEATSFSWVQLSDLEKGDTIAAVWPPANCPKQQATPAHLLWDKIQSIEPAGRQSVYDVETKGPYRAFIANGLVTHNSHAAAYADLTYKTAYVKAHYPAEFAAALLTTECGEREKLVHHVADTRARGLTVLPPNINKSTGGFTVDEDGAILFGLSAVKGVGSAAGEILRARQAVGGQFQSLYHFLESVVGQGCNQGAVVALIRSGAFDSMLSAGQSRANLEASVPAFIKKCKKIQTDRARGQADLFDAIGGASPEPPLAEVAAWSSSEQLSRERGALDLYLTGHPLQNHAAIIRQLHATPPSRLVNSPSGRQCLAAGMIIGLEVKRLTNGRNAGRAFARFQLEDESAAVSCILWPEELEACFLPPADGDIVVAAGEWQQDRGGDGKTLVIKALIPAADAPKRLARRIRLTLPAASEDSTPMSPERLQKLAVVLAPYRGEPKKRVPLRISSGDWEFDPGESLNVDPSLIDLGAIEEAFGPGSVCFDATR